MYFHFHSQVSDWFVLEDKPYYFHDTDRDSKS